MPTTTNYGWTTPADTDLVKDGASAIRTLGSGVDTTVKNLNPETTLGDISYRSATSNTNTRLAIGTTGQVLTVSGGVPAWANAAAGGYTELASGSFPTGASTLTISSISGGYRDLVLVCKNVRTGVDNDNIALRFNGDTGSSYFDNLFLGEGTTDTAPGTLLRFIGNVDNSAGNTLAIATIYEYESTTWKLASSIFITPNSTTTANARGQAYQGGANITSAVTSITVYSTNASNFAAGTYVLYGVK